MLIPKGCYHWLFVLLPSDGNTAWLFNTFTLSTAVAHRGFFTTFFFSHLHCELHRNEVVPLRHRLCSIYHLNQILKWLLLKLSGSAQAFLWSVDIWGTDLILWKGWSFFWRSLSTCFFPFSVVKGKWWDSCTTHLRWRESDIQSFLSFLSRNTHTQKD